MESKHEPFFNSSFYPYSPWYRPGVTCWRPIFENCPQKCVHKESIIYSQEENNKLVFLIHKGRVRLSSFNRHGNEKSIVIISEGNIFGEISAIGRFPSLVTATALTDCTLFYIPSELFFQKVLADPVLSKRFILELMQIIRILIGHIFDMSFLDARERVIVYLFMLSIQYGFDTPQGRKITIRFTHQEMADLTGTCRVTVSKIMKSLDKSNVIKKINGYLFILDQTYFLKKIEEIV